MWKDCSCKINFICIYPGVGIRSQPESGIINPLQEKKEKVSICIQGFSCLPGSFLLFHSTCWCCQVPYSCCHFVCCWLVCWFSNYNSVPSILSSLPPFFPCFPTSFFSFSSMGVNNLKNTFTSTKKGCSCNKFCIQEYCDKLFDQTFVSVWRHIFLRAVSTEMLSLFIYFIPEKTCTYRKVIFYLEEDLGLAEGARAAVRPW